MKDFKNTEDFILQFTKATLKNPSSTIFSCLSFYNENQDEDDVIESLTEFVDETIIAMENESDFADIVARALSYSYASMITLFFEGYLVLKDAIWDDLLFEDQLSALLLYPELISKFDQTKFTTDNWISFLEKHPDQILKAPCEDFSSSQICGLLVKSPELHVHFDLRKLIFTSDDLYNLLYYQPQLQNYCSIAILEEAKLHSLALDDIKFYKYLDLERLTGTQWFTLLIKHSRTIEKDCLDFKGFDKLKPNEWEKLINNDEYFFKYCDESKLRDTTKWSLHCASTNNLKIKLVSEAKNVSSK